MLTLIQQHPTIAGVILMWLVGNGVSAMPTPKDDSSALYEWFFKFMQPIGAALPRLMAVYSPQTLSALTGQKVTSNVPADTSLPAVPNPEQSKVH
jgi:hypothetical protein